jgi:hypothetical protein
MSGPLYRDATTQLPTEEAPAQSANTVYAGPTSGSAAAPTFRALVAADIPLGYPDLFYLQAIG